MQTKPWISDTTLNLISERNLMRYEGNYDRESLLSKKVRASAQDDKRKYIQEELANGSWHAVKKLRMKPTKKYVQMRNVAGDLVEFCERPNTMAKYFEEVQWKVQFPDLVLEATSILHPDLHIPTSNFQIEELQRVLSKLKHKKSKWS